MKQEEVSVWDDMACCFATRQSGNTYAPGAENFSVVWPVLQPLVKELLSFKLPCSALDFGCGTGIFAETISNYCASVYACDSSEKMIAEALKNSTGKVIYGVGGADFVYNCPNLSLITAIMVFQFIEDIEEIVHLLCEMTKSNGYIFFATHDIDYAKECISNDCKFRNINALGEKMDGEILISGHWIKTYIRSEKLYEEIFNQYGFEKVGSIKKHVEPPFEVDSDIPWKSNKYYMAWYRKKILQDY